MEEQFEAWRKKPSPEAMGSFLEAAEPVLQSALKSYAGGNPALRSKARALAVRAAQSYDPKQGTKLKTHLMTQLQPLQRFSKQYSSVVKTPERISLDLYHMSEGKRRFMDENGREPSDQELADATGMSARRLAKIRGFARGEMAESSLLENDEGEQAIMYPGVARVDPNQVWLEYVHHDLDPIGKQILEWKTGYNGKPVLSTNEIAQKLKITPGAVSQRAAKIAERINEGAMLG